MDNLRGYRSGADSADECTPIVSQRELKAQSDETHVKSSLSKLRDGLMSWVQSNTEREDTLVSTLNSCDVISNNQVDKRSLLREAERKQMEQRESISQATAKVEKQTELLKDLEDVVNDIKKRGKELEDDMSLFGPPRCVFWFLFWVLVISILLTALAFVLKEGLGIKHIVETSSDSELVVETQFES